MKSQPKPKSKTRDKPKFKPQEKPQEKPRLKPPDKPRFKPQDEPKYKRDGAELWVSAAYVILVADGHAGLTVEGLTTRTGKTRGSFYHHFGSHSGFIARLLDDWRRRHTERIEHLIAAAAEPRQRRYPEP